MLAHRKSDPGSLCHVLGIPCTKAKMLQVFAVEIGDCLFVALCRAIFCLQSGVQVMRWMIDPDEIKESLAPQSMLSLDDATFVCSSCGEDILQGCMCEGRPKSKFRFEEQRNIVVLFY